MKIYFVRHGHPDYTTDSLTELGHKHAAAAANRLKTCGIERIFASTMGRARQTAEHTANQLGLEIIPCEFMREISWGPMGDEQLLDGGHPWLLTARTISEGKTLCDPDWRLRENFCNNKLLQTTNTVITGLDALLTEFGYEREGDYYRVVKENTDKTIAIFSHGTASATAFSHLFNVPLPQVIGLIHIDYTCVTVVELPNKYGKLVYPTLVSTDAHHIKGLETENGYGN